jgi:hypothetical protein
VSTNSNMLVLSNASLASCNRDSSTKKISVVYDDTYNTRTIQVTITHSVAAVSCLECHSQPMAKQLHQRFQSHLNSQSDLLSERALHTSLIITESKIAFGKSNCTVRVGSDGDDVARRSLNAISL